MTGEVSSFVETGLEVIDLRDDVAFGLRHLHTRNIAAQMEGLRRLTRAFVESPDTILQELVNAAVDLCGADSAGISIEREGGTEESFYQWTATAGRYAPFLNATLPRYPSACGMCIARGNPQFFRVSQRFFDIMGVVAPVVEDGLLLPWHVGETRGTIWIMSHENPRAFDSEDLRMMQVLADFAAMAVRHQTQQRELLAQTSVTAAASMANDLAHQINNPLQSLTNLVYLANSKDPAVPDSLAHDLSENLNRLSLLVSRLLSLPIGAAQQK